MKNYLELKRFKIKNTDNLCLARAIVVAVAKLENDPKYQSVINGDRGRETSLQKRRAV